VMSAGFNVGQEVIGNIHRIIVMGIPSSMVVGAIYRLAAVGVNQVWIREF